MMHINPSLFTALILAIASSLAGCTTTSISNYSPMNTRIGETKEWEMPLNREPGRIDLKLLFAIGSSTNIAFKTASEIEQAPMHLFFNGGDCSKGPDISVKYSVGRGVFSYKHFQVPLLWQNDVSISIRWDDKGEISISVDGENINVRPYIAFRKLHIWSDSGAVIIKELSYTKLNEFLPTTQGSNQ
jgi:hypothetical protein